MSLLWLAAAVVPWVLFAIPAVHASLERSLPGYSGLLATLALIGWTIIACFAAVFSGLVSLVRGERRIAVAIGAGLVAAYVLSLLRG